MKTVSSTNFISSAARKTLFLFVLAAPLPAAAEIRKIIHPDGRVEYTNVGKQGTPVPPTNKATSKPNSTVVYKYRQQDGNLSFTNMKPKNVKYEIVRIDCYACNPSSTVNWHTTRLNTAAYQQQVAAAAETYKIDPALIRAVIHAESAFNEKALSRKGAQGLMQLMPGTADELGVSDAMDASQNIQGGAKYLANLMGRFNGDTRLATAAYNAGPGAVSRYGGIPPYAETQAYVERVAILKERYKTAQ